MFKVTNTDQEALYQELELEMVSHPAWHADLSGVDCEAVLRGHPVGSYLLREGEKRFQYYLSFVLGNDFTFKHQPFRIELDRTNVVWGFRNGHFTWEPRLAGLIPVMMHCDAEKCIPVLKTV